MIAAVFMFDIWNSVNTQVVVEELIYCEMLQGVSGYFYRQVTCVEGKICELQRFITYC